MLNKIEFLEEIKKNIKVNNENLLLETFDFVKEIHKDKKDGGEAYFTHQISVALLAAEYKLDENSIIASLLHYNVEDAEINLEQINKKFGEQIAYLVNGLVKIDNAKLKSTTEKNSENFRKLILSTSKDIRILIIKLIDRLSSMRTIFRIEDITQRCRIANETMLIYVVLAERIGMYKLKLELEDLCFQELFPIEREEITKNIKKTQRNKKNIIDEIIKKISTQLKFENNINCKILGRVKRPI